MWTDEAATSEPKPAYVSQSSRAEPPPRSAIETPKRPSNGVAIALLVVLVGLSYVGFRIYSAWRTPSAQQAQSPSGNGTQSAPSILATLYVTGEGVRIHDQPDLGSNVIGSANEGDKLGVVTYDPSGQWAQVTLPGISQTGWIARQYLANTMPAENPNRFSATTNLFLVRIGNQVGYIDDAGKLVIQPRFEASSRDFSEGLAAVGLNRGYGYIDKTGKFAIQPQFEGVGDFHEELAAARLNNRWGYIDKTGKFVIQPQFDIASDFHDGLAAVELNNKWGYIDKAGMIVIQPQFYPNRAGDFRDGLATVQLNNETGHFKFGYIDKRGKLAIQRRFDNASDFHEGLAAVVLNNKWGYIDKTGRLAIQRRFDNASDFHEGLAAVRMNGKMGYIDTTGRYVIQPEFDVAEDFSEGMAAVNVNGKWGCIDKSGTLVIQPRFAWVQEFRQGFAWVYWEEGEQTLGGYINKNGNLIFKAQFVIYEGDD